LNARHLRKKRGKATRGTGSKDVDRGINEQTGSVFGGRGEEKKRLKIRRFGKCAMTGTFLLEKRGNEQAVRQHPLDAGKALL